MILRKTVLAAGALAALLVSASVGSAKPTTSAKPSAALPAQCSTKLMTLRPHYPDPVKPLGGAASSLSGAGSTFVAPIMSMWAQAYSKKGTNVAYQGIGSGGGQWRAGWFTNAGTAARDRGDAEVISHAHSPRREGSPDQPG